MIKQVKYNIKNKNGIKREKRIYKDCKDNKKQKEIDKKNNVKDNNNRNT